MCLTGVEMRAFRLGLPGVGDAAFDDIEVEVALR